MKIVVADGDLIEEKNLVRQNFIAADLGRNKAQVLAERYSSAFGTEALYIPEFIEAEERLAGLVKPDSAEWRLSRQVFLPVIAVKRQDDCGDC